SGGLSMDGVRTPLDVVFFLQAEDGIRDWSVTGVQTCALPTSHRRLAPQQSPASEPAGQPPRPLPARQPRPRQCRRPANRLSAEPLSCRADPPRFPRLDRYHTAAVVRSRGGTNGKFSEDLLPIGRALPG